MCEWKESPLGKLQVLPTTAKPITSWSNRDDEAWADVVRGLREAFEQISSKTHIPNRIVEPAEAPSESIANDTCSIQVYAKHGGFRSVLTDAKDVLISEGHLSDFEPPTTKHWQHKYERVGWRLFVDKRRDSFGFMGIFEGETTIRKGIPDLYFFLEMRRGDICTERGISDSKVQILRERIVRLGAQHGTIKWGYEPGGYQSVWAVRSLFDMATCKDVPSATIDFFRTCVTSLRQCGVLDEFLLHARAW